MNAITDEPTLHATVIKMMPREATTVRATQGHQAHAAFLHTIRAVDPDLSTALHDTASGSRPFTLSNLRGARRVHGKLHLSPQDDLWLRLTVLHPRIQRLFMGRFLAGSGGPTMRLGHATLSVHAVIATPEGHPWSGYTTWQELVTTARPEPEITLAFVAPTAFSFGQQPWGKKVVVLPQPDLVFDSLARTWNAYAPPHLQMERDALHAYLDNHTVIKRIDTLRTHMLRFKRSMQVGFTGRVTYGLMADNEIARVQLNALADAAFYLGVGYKTTMGLGQCRRERGRRR
jgi:CRISPR-associated endoribonuclease Cas6